MINNCDSLVATVTVQHDHYYGLDPTEDVKLVRLQYSHVLGKGSINNRR